MGNTLKQDNTRVSREYAFPFKLSKEQQDTIKQRKLDKVIKRNQSVIYDTKKAKHYQNMQNFYNNNFFGYGVFGNQTNYNPTKEEDQQKIQANFNYSKDNVKNLGETLITTSILGPFKGVLPSTSKRVTVGNLSALTPYKIGEGAEAIVIKNSPTTVGKITQVGSGEMLKRNAVPNSSPVKFVGYVRDGSKRFPTFIQKKMKILTEKLFQNMLINQIRLCRKVALGKLMILMFNIELILMEKLQQMMLLLEMQELLFLVNLN